MLIRTPKILGINCNVTQGYAAIANDSKSQG